MSKMKLIKSKFTFTEYDNFPIYEGYYDPLYRYWNGWSCPYFTKDTRDAFIKYEEKLLSETSKNYQEENKEFLEGLHAIESEIINGKELYYFGGSLCWDEVQK